MRALAAAPEASPKLKVVFFVRSGTRKLLLGKRGLRWRRGGIAPCEWCSFSLAWAAALPAVPCHRAGVSCLPGGCKHDCVWQRHYEERRSEICDQSAKERVFRSCSEALSGSVRPLPEQCSRRLRVHRKSLVSRAEGGLDERESQTRVAAEQRNHSFAAMKQAAVENALAVFQGWKCNGLSLFLDSVEANCMAQLVMLTESNCSSVFACSKSVAPPQAATLWKTNEPAFRCLCLSFDLCIPTKRFHCLH